MPKLLAIASTLTTLAVLATSGTVFAGNVVRDHRHAATPPAANSPPPAAKKDLFYYSVREKVHSDDRWKRHSELDDKKRQSKLGPAGGSTVPAPGKTTQQK